MSVLVSDFELLKPFRSCAKTHSKFVFQKKRGPTFVRTSSKQFGLVWMGQFKVGLNQDALSFLFYRAGLVTGFNG